MNPIQSAQNSGTVPAATSSAGVSAALYGNAQVGLGRVNPHAHQGAMAAPNAANQHLAQVAPPFTLNLETLTDWSDNGTGGNEQFVIEKGAFAMALYELPGQNSELVKIPGVAEGADTKRCLERCNEAFKISSAENLGMKPAHIAASVGLSELLNALQRRPCSQRIMVSHLPLLQLGAAILSA